ncbi:MAG: hypothetical protein K8L97_28500 [Anaerolineae bacterium]|nr:hypothetical protein [Anaerolineae bacterium]
MTRRLLFGLIFILLIPLFVAQAQAPEPINAALTDLGSRLGRTITLNDLDNWTFVGPTSFPNAAMGCPQPGAVYPDVLTVGYQFSIIYAGVNHDYRVSTDQRLVVLCGTTAAPAATPSCPPPGDADYLAPRLAIGGLGRVEEGGLPNLLRDIPGTSGKLLGQIEPGQAFTVQAGPSCSLSDKMVWWQVNHNGIVGWTSEGDDLDYWLEPLNPDGTVAVAPVPAQAPITAANARQAVQLSTGSGVVTVAPGEAWFAFGQSNGTIALFDARMFTQKSILSGHTGAVNALAFNTDGTRLISGAEDGLVIVWQVNTDGTGVEFKRLSGHTAPIKSLTFNPDGTLAASGDANGGIYVWDINAGGVVMILNGHTAPVIGLSFSAKGALLASEDDGGTWRLWGIPPGATG